MDRVRSSTILEHVPFYTGSELVNVKKQPKRCCQLSYRVRRLKNRGAVLVLLWTFLVTCIFYFYENENHGIVLNIQLAAGCLTLPIAGWLADIYFGRYKLMYLSMWITWASILLETANSVVAEMVEGYGGIGQYVSGVFMVTAVIGFGGFQANVIQFGVDQLSDASTSEITSFINWYIWCAYSSPFFVDLILAIIDCVNLEPRMFGLVVVCTQLSIALCSVVLFNHWLVKEPITQNPFGLVYNVIKYAVQHKQPRLRSAFTFCEDELPSRIDFGKSKYGGPFTTEQVEDVKTFLRMLVVGFLECILLGIAVSVFMLKELITKLLISSQKSTKGQLVKNCDTEKVLQQIFIYSWVVVIPLYEFVFYPLFSRCLAELSSQIKFVFGLLLHGVSVVALMLIVIIARHNSLKHNTGYQNNATMECVLSQSEGNSAMMMSLDSRWMAVPNFLYSVSITILGISIIEFGISQAPYSMRGLIMGSAYGVICLSGVVAIAVRVPFAKPLPIWGTPIIGCGFWYTLLLLVAEMAVGITLVIALKLYKKRKREDVLPSEHIFAERYYAKY